MKKCHLKIDENGMSFCGCCGRYLEKEETKVEKIKDYIMAWLCCLLPLIFIFIILGMIKLLFFL